MRKTGNPAQRAAQKAGPPRGHWVSDRDADPARGGGTAKRSKKAHFLEPYRLCEARRAALLELLAGHAVGDPESRDLFAAAVEYGIASCRAGSRTTLPRPEAVPERVDPEGTLGALAEAARLLAERLKALGEQERGAILNRLGASDPFGRVHDTAYLDAVGREVSRVAEAATASLEAAPPAPDKGPGRGRPTVPVADAARRLILRVADAYEDCFEAKVQPETGPAFVPVLRLLGEEAGIAVPSDPASLQEVLRRR